MRLGQLARHLETTPEKIVSHLARQGYEFSSHHNTKLPEELELDVLKSFGKPPESLPEFTEIRATEAIEKPIEKVETIVEEISEEETKVVEEVLVTEEPEEEIPVIRAPKVELPGLRVVGKIDLPEPKLKEKPKEEEAPVEPEKEQPEPTIRYVKHSSKNKRKQLTPEELEEQRIANKKHKERREEERRRREKEQEENRRLAKKRKHYEQKVVKVKKVDTPKKAKTKTEPTSKPQTAAPRTLLGKFWKWLNT